MLEAMELAIQKKGGKGDEKGFMLLSLLVPSVQSVRVFEHREVH